LVEKREVGLYLRDNETNKAGLEKALSTDEALNGVELFIYLGLQLPSNF